VVSVEIWLYILIFISLLLFGLGTEAFIGSFRGRREIIERLKQIGEGTHPQEEKGSFSSLINFGTKFIERLGVRFKPKEEKKASILRMTLVKAGYRRVNAPVIFYGIKVFSAILSLVTFLVLRLWFFKTITYQRSFGLSIALALIGFYLPDLWVRTRFARRRERIQEGLPDALDLMVVCVEAGNGLDAAVNRVAEEMRLENKVLSEEFRLLNLEVRAGKQRQDALRNLAERTGVEDISTLVTLLIQTEKFGTSIGQALRVHSDAMRTKRFQRAEEIANKMPVKLIFPLVFFIFPALLVVVLGPAVITISKALLHLGRG